MVSCHWWWYIQLYSFKGILNVSFDKWQNNKNFFQCNDLNCRKTEHLNAITDDCVSLYVSLTMQRHFQNVVPKNISNRTGLRWSRNIKTLPLFGNRFGLTMVILEMVSLHISCVRHETNTIILYAGQRQIKLDYDGLAWLRMSHLVIWGILDCMQTHYQVIYIKSLHRNWWGERRWEYHWIIFEQISRYKYNSFI